MTEKWPAIDPSTVAPVKDGRPDLYNHLPTRFVTKDEAAARGWKYFYVGDACRYGHRAPRFVSNPRMCVDCHRVRDGRLPMGGKAEAEYDKRTLRPYAQPVRDGSSTSQPTRAIVPVEPDTLEKRFLVKYAELKDFAKAAIDVGRSEAEFLGRLSYSKVFRDAVHQLEQDCGLSRTPSFTEDFEWTDDKRVVLMRVYVDTGDLLKAMRSIGVTNYHFERELRDNPDFRAGMEEAEELANKQLDREAVSMAKAGDSRLLQRVLAAKMPETWGDRVNVNMNVTQKLTDDQLTARLAQSLTKLERLAGAGIIQLTSAPEVVEAEFSPVDPPGETAAPGDAGCPAAPDRTQSNSDLV
jgi:hypothetical protein